jgi:hypothetical protein
MTVADAERLKRNLTYALHQYKSATFEIFKRMIWALLYHHFNIHDTCGEWCAYLRNKDKPEELKKLHYRSKEKNPKLYQQLLTIWEVYGTDEALKEVHHEWHTNKCESMNMFITKFVRKTSHLCMTIVGKSRTYLAVSIDSLGYEEYYRTLLPLLNLDYDDTVMNTHHVRLDKLKMRKAIYDKLPAVKRRNATARAIRIRENFRKLIQDKKAGKTYGSGINDPSKKEEQGAGETKQKLPCKHCGKLGHSMKTHRDCTFSTYRVRKKKGKLRQKNVTVPMSSFRRVSQAGTNPALNCTYRESWRSNRSYSFRNVYWKYWQEFQNCVL